MGRDLGRGLRRAPQLNNPIHHRHSHSRRHSHKIPCRRDDGATNFFGLSSSSSSSNKSSLKDSSFCCSIAARATNSRHYHHHRNKHDQKVNPSVALYLCCS